MRTLLACAAMLAALGASAQAEVRYDRKLEEAVKARVAAKIGEIRGGFDHDDLPEFVQPDAMIDGAVVPSPDKPAARAQAKPRQGSLRLAVDRKPSRRVF